ncbi:MAG: metalloregulator ArsR/SmtB family transcription factor, partial [Acidobacteriota bacterium]
MNDMEPVENGTSTEEHLVWKALADPTRRAILDLLRGDAMTTGALVEHFAMSRYGVMKHLQVLHGAGLILIRRQGRERFNHLNTVPIRQIYRRWMQPFAEPSADALLRLKALAEQGEPTMTDTSTPTLRAIDIQQEIRIAATPDRVWSSLTDNVAAWWPNDFYIGPAPRGFVVEARVGGRVYEDWGDDQGGLWATITVCEHGRVLQWVGDLAPDFGGPARSITTFTLVAEGDETVVRFRDASFGALSESAQSSLDSGWRFLLADCLKPYVETGAQPKRPDTVVEAEAA